MKKVLLVVPSLGVGGAESMVAQLAISLEQRKMEVTIISIQSERNNLIEKNLNKHNIRIKYINHEEAPNLKSMITVWKEINKIKPDIIHTHLSAFIYACPWIFLKRKRILHTIHSRPICEFSNRVQLIMKLLYFFKKVVPIAISDTIARETVELYNIKNRKVEVIYNPVNISLFSSEKVDIKEYSKKITFINIARFNEVKNQNLLLDAFIKIREKNKNVKLIFVGDGELRNSIEKKVQDYGLNNVVEFTGNIENVAEKLAVADIFVLPSRYEGLPLTILEAMAAGKPIIASNVGGIPDIVKDNGILFKENDLEGLIKAMDMLILNEELRKKMGGISIKNVKPFDLECIVSQYENLYTKNT